MNKVLSKHKKTGLNGFRLILAVSMLASMVWTAFPIQAAQAAAVQRQAGDQTPQSAIQALGRSPEAALTAGGPPGSIQADTPAAPAAPIINNPTQVDSLYTDVNGNSLVNPGDTLQYTIVVRNTGPDPATTVAFSETVGANLTYVAGTLKSTPLAANDSYAALGNVRISAAAPGVLANDTDPDGGALSLTPFSGSSAQGGSVTLNADGSFSYNPPRGYEGADSFPYTLTDDEGDSDTGTVTITVAGMIWFINNNAGACASSCDGRLTNPYTTLTSFNAVNNGTGNNPAAGDNIFVYESAASYTGPLTLLNNQRLIGQDATQTLVDLTGLSLLPLSDPLPVMNTGAPAATLIGGTNAIVLASGNHLYGFTSGNATGASITGTNFGALSVRDVILNSSGQALALATGSFAVAPNNAFTSITSSGGANNVSLTGVTGTGVLGTGALSGATSHALVVDGGNGTLTYSGSIANSTARAVLVQNKTGGTVTLSGAVNSTGQGILLNSNTGATITFSGNLTLNTGANPAFTATGGGTVNATNTNSTITTSTGRAVNIANTTLGASGVTFRSIAVTGSGLQPVNAVILDTTGSSGFFKVLGDGSLAQNGSGGTIQSTGGDAVYLNNAFNVTLQSVVLRNTGQDAGQTNRNAIRSVGGGTFIFSGLKVETPATNGWLASQLTGSNYINSGSLFTGVNGTGAHGIFASNTTANLTILEINNTTFRDSLSDASMVVMETAGSGNMRLDVINGCLFENIVGQAVTSSAGNGVAPFGTLTTNITGNTFRNAHYDAGIPIYGESNVAATVINGATQIAAINNNTFNNIALDGGIANTSVIRTQNNGGTWQGTVNGNTISNINTKFGGGRHGIGHIFEPVAAGPGNYTQLTIDNNNVSGLLDSSSAPSREAVFIDLRANAGDADIRVTNNTFGPNIGGTQQMVEVRARQTTAKTVDLLVQNNTITGSTINRIIDIDAEQNAIVNATVLNNPLGGSSSSISYVDMASEQAATVACTNISGNSVPGGGPILLTQVGTLNVTQASAPAMQAANPGSAVSVTGAPTFGQPPCALPPVAPAIPAANPLTVPASVLNPSAGPADSTVDPEAAAERQGTEGTQDTASGAAPADATPPAAEPAQDKAPLADTLPAAPAGPTPTNLSLTIGTLDAGKAVTITLRAVVDSPFPASIGQVSSQGRVTAAGGINKLTDDPAAAGTQNPTVTIIDAAPDLTLTKSDGGITTTPGSTVAYTLGYSNKAGANQHAGNVTLNETVPADTTFNPGASTAGWVCLPNNNAGSACTLNIGTLNVGASGSAAFAVTVANPVPAGVTQISNSASIGSDRTDATPADNSASDTTPVTAQPDLTLTKSDGGASVAPGGTVGYTLNYANAGNQNATGVVLNEIVPANTAFNPGASTAGWVCAPNNNAGSACTLTIGSLNGGGANGSATFAVTVVSPAPSGLDQISNTASAADDGSNGADPTPGDNSSTDTTPVTAAPDLTITKSDGGISVFPGDGITYTLGYSNTGNQHAAGVVLTETVPVETTFNPAASTPGWVCLPNNNAGSACTFTIGALAVGGSGTVTFAVTTDSPIAPGTTQIDNTAGIADDGSNGADLTPADNQASEATPVIAIPDLTLSKSDGGISVAPGDTVTYTLSYTNVGSQTAVGVTLTETVPADSAFNAAGSTAGWSCADGSPAGTTCTLNIGTLNVGASGAAAFAVTVVNPFPAGAAQISNSALIADNGVSGADPSPANNTASDTTPVNAAPDLTITKSDGGASVIPGGTVAYTLNYANAGNQNATGVALNETVPANTTFNPGASTAGWVCAPNNNAGSTCTLAIGSLAGGASGSATFAVTVASPVPAGVTQISNTASTADDGSNGADPTPANNAASDTTPMNAAPDLTITKSDGGASAIPGGTVVYTLNYANTGNQNATGVALNETVPADSAFNPGASTAGWVCVPNNNAGSACTLPIGSLAGGGANGSATFAVDVVNPIPAGVTQISNTASAADDGSNGADPNPGDNSSTDTTPVNAAPDLALGKSDGGISVIPGSTIAYTLSYTNNGDQGASGVTLTETVPANTTFDAAGSTAGWSCADGSPAGTPCSLNIGGLAGGGANGSATFAVTVDSPIPPGVVMINNTAGVLDDGANGADPLPADNTASDTTPITALPDLTLSKDDGGITAQPGDTITYTLAYSNTGNKGATGLVLTDTVPANTTFNAAASTPGWSCADGSPAGTVCNLSLGSLAGGGAGGSAAFAVTAAAALPAGVTQVDNTASLGDDGSNGPDPNPADNSASDFTPLDAAPDLILSKSDGGASALPGGVVVYTLSYTSTGNQDATGAALTETVPLGTQFNTAASTPGWSCADGSPAGTICVLSLGSLNVGASGAANFAVTVLDPAPAGLDQIDNTALLGDDGSNGADLNPADNTAGDSTPLNAEPDLGLAKDDGGASTQPGSGIAYTLTYSNTGTQDAAGVVLTETVPANTTFDAGGSTAGWSCADGSPAGTACILAIGALGANSSAAVTFAVTVDNPVPSGVTQIDNSASLADDGSNGADPNPADNSASDSTPLDAQPDLLISKDDGGAFGYPGSTISYTLTYTNSGDQGATGVTLTDTVPANTTFDAGNSTAGWSCANGAPAGTVCTFNIANLAGGSGGSVVFAVTVDSPFPVGVTQVDNTASLGDDGSNGADPNPADNSASDSTPIEIVVDVQLAKQAGSQQVQPGGALVYVLQVTNIGAEFASGVTLTDSLPLEFSLLTIEQTPGITLTPGSSYVWTFADLAPGASGVITLTGVVSTGLPAGYTFTNTAVISGDQLDLNPDNNQAQEPVSISNAAPAASGDAYTTAEDTALNITAPGVLANDSDANGDALSAVLGSSPANGTLALQADGSFTYTPDQDFNGQDSFTYHASDGAAPSNTATVLITVTAVNDAPVVNAGPDQAVLDGTTVQFAGSFSDPDAGDTHTILWDFGDGLTTTAGLTPTHLYAAPGVYTAALTVTDAAGEPGSDTTVITVTELTTVDLAISKTASKDPVLAGDDLVYTLVVTNNGQAAATGVMLVDQMPSAVTFSPLPTGCSRSGNTITCNLGTLAGGASATRQITARVKTSARTSLTNQASVSSDVEDADPADNQVSLTTAVIPFLPIYDEDFEDIPGSEWCTTGRSTTPSGRTFLGEFGNEHTCLSLDNLPKHTQVIVEVELYAIRSWDGSQVEWGTQMLQRYGPPSPSDPNYIVGPDRWIMQADGKTLLDTTFANWGEFPQAYPGPYPASTYPARTGAAENNTLGYTYGPADMDSVYHLKFTIPHTASTLELDFAAIGLLPDLLDESWGIDNVAVAISFGGGQTIVYLPAISR